jgi:hypothetical protein
MLTARNFIYVFVALASVAIAWLTIGRALDAQPARVANLADPQNEAALADAAREKHLDEQDPEATQAPSELELLNRIRSQIGSPLGSSLFESGDGDAADSFNTAYRREALESLSDPAPLYRSSPLLEQQRDPHSLYSAALRDAARTLDTRAADLEDEASYELADQLRTWAGKMRSDARDVVAPTEPGDE